MKLEKYNELKLKLEIFRFEKNYFTLNRILYYFSFLGNLFLIYFGYFFVKSVTESIPTLFPFQDTFFTIFVALFLTGYELTKRFTLDQLFISIVQKGKLTIATGLGIVVAVLLIAGSFYLSIKGSHRLVDNTGVIAAVTDSTTKMQADSVASYYNKEIKYYRNQPAYTRDDRKYRDSIVNALEQAKTVKIAEVEDRAKKKSETSEDVNKENSTAFLFITVFLELIVLLGVGFNAYYTIGSYTETGNLLQTPKFKQLDLNLRMLKLYYQNGKKSPGDPPLSYTKFKSLIDNQKLNCSHKEAKSFITLCQELDIVKTQRGKRSEILVTYQQAKELMENQDIV